MSGTMGLESPSGSDILDAWLHTTHCISFFLIFLFSFLLNTTVTTSTILSPSYPVALCNLHVNYFKNLLYLLFLTTPSPLLGELVGAMDQLCSPSIAFVNN